MLLALALASALAAADPADPVAPPRPSLRQVTEAAGLPWPPPDFWIGVDKSERTLVAWSGALPLKTWPVGLGEPAGDKRRQGDRRTPDGTFHVVTRNARSRFHRFLGLDYPRPEDADRGLRAGWITREEAEAIRAAAARGARPPWNTALGGAIGIHGGGSATDWTLGCIALDDAALDELWPAARLGTPVVITE